MKILLNVESLLTQSGGIGTYTRNLLSGLNARAMLDEHSCFANYKWVRCVQSSNGNSCQAESSPKHNNNLKKCIKSIPYTYEVYSYLQGMLFKHKSRQLKDYIYHEPNYVLKPFSGQSVMTVHDLSHVRFPQFHPVERVKYFNKNLEKSIDRTSHVITDSNFIREELINEYGVSPEKVTTVHIGVSDDYYPHPGNLQLDVLARYGLTPDCYLLSVATLEPRKNIDQLLDAYMRIGKKIRREYPLVLVGREGWKVTGLMKKIDDLVLKGEVIHLGFVPDADLPYLFSGARGLAYIPLYEGFGLPPLEAMASGTPVLASDVASIPEVVGDSACLINPYDNDQIKDGLETLLLDDKWRNNAIKKSLLRAKDFAWDKCIDKTIDVYKKI